MHRFNKTIGLALLVLPLVRAEPNITVSNKDYTAGTASAECAQYILKTSGTVVIRNTAQVRFRAGSHVTLYLGFKVESGGPFRAIIAYTGL